MQKKIGFSHIVCGSKDVQDAFALYRPMRSWWRLVLRLHGKPTNPHLESEEKLSRIAEGFRFYATLYRMLAVIFGLLVPALLLATSAESASLYWPIASLLAAIYLWLASGLGYAGAASYRRGEVQGTIALLAFIVMVVAFLSMFLAVVSVAGHHHRWAPTLPNVLSIAALFVFGTGSYLIEIIYLANGQPVAQTES